MNTRSKAVSGAVVKITKKLPKFMKVISICIVGFFIGLGLAEYLDIVEPEKIVEEKIVFKEVPKNIHTNGSEVIVEYFLKMEPRLDPKVAKIYADAVSESSKKYHLPPAIIVSMIDKESYKYGPLSISKAGCVGLMQINPKAHPDKIKNLSKEELFHVDKNIDIGCRILRDYIGSEGSIEKALHKYSGGAKDYVEDVLIRFAELTLFHYETFGIETEKKKKIPEFTIDEK